MSKFKKTILMSLAAIFLLFFALQIDDELSAEVISIIDSVDWHKESKSYIYLLGIGAPLGEDPFVEGESILSHQRKDEARYDDYNFHEDLAGSYVERPSLELPDHDLLCHVRVENCLESLFGEMDFDLGDPKVVELKKRYVKFMDMDAFNSMAKPHMFEAFPSLHLLIRGNRILSLSAIDKANHCCPHEAIEDLYALIDLQKSYIEKTDTLIARMISYVLLNETVDVLSLLIEKFSLSAREIELIDMEQLDLERVINRELVFYYNSYIGLLAYEGNWKFLPRWARRTLYKKNITINALLPHYQDVITKSKLSQLEFAKQSSVKKNLQRHWIRNYVGTSLYTEENSFEFEPYIGRGFDLNSKITLFNKLLGKKLTIETLETIANPYYDDEFDASYDPKTNRVCFGGPYDNVGFTRCIVTFKKLEKGSYGVRVN